MKGSYGYVVEIFLIGKVVVSGGIFLFFVVCLGIFGDFAFV